MHRHGYKGRKFGRETDQRRALLRGLMVALVSSHEIETTEPKAKELRRVMEKVITTAKKSGLANRRQVISKLNDIKAANKLIDEIAPKITRDSGYLRIVRTKLRVGDNAQMAKISFVDDLSVESKKPEATKAPAKKEKK
jgi:ribosomal protein L17